MKRSVRRYQQRVAKARRVRILLRHRAWTPSSYWHPKIWQPLCRLVMSEPGRWVHERVILPARTKAHRLEREVKRGRRKDKGANQRRFSPFFRYPWVTGKTNEL
ncbi:MAG: hypothetical protein JWO52_2152 [Gammaproteobacteria bacterium]|jgi:hypothetical protein|nr:hypothetical protein [Gammaproteobacteria bacterium]